MAKPTKVITIKLAELLAVMLWFQEATNERFDDLIWATLQLFVDPDSYDARFYQYRVRDFLINSVRYAMANPTQVAILTAKYAIIIAGWKKIAEAMGVPKSVSLPFLKGVRISFR